MSQLDEILDQIEDQPGARSIFLLGRDGLMVHARGGSNMDREAVAAMVPEVLSAAANLGQTADLGDVTTVVLELEAGVAIVAALSDDLALAVLVDPGAEFARLLGTIRNRREALISAI